MEKRFTTHTPRRMLVLTTSWPAFPGDPSGHFVAAEAQREATRGDAVTVLAPGAPRQVSWQSGVELVRTGGGELFGWPGVLTRVREKPTRMAQLPGWLRAMRRELVRRRPEVIVAHWVVPTVWPLLAELPFEATVEAVSHGSDVRMILALPMPLRARMVAWMLRRVASWRFVSESLREELLAGLPMELGQRVLVRSRIEASPIELPDVAAAARALRASVARDHLYVTAARLVAAKRIDVCLDWLAANEATGHLVVLGDGPERAALTARARSLGLSVDFRGTVPRDQALAWIAAADGILHASRAEGASTVLREAAHYGTRIVDLTGVSAPGRPATS